MFLKQFSQVEKDLFSVFPCLARAGCAGHAASRGKNAASGHSGTSLASMSNLLQAMTKIVGCSQLLFVDGYRSL